MNIFAFLKKKPSDEQVVAEYKSIVLVGLAQALGAFGYIALVSFFLAVAGQILGYLSPLVVQIVMLLIIVLSVLALSMIFLYYPLFLYARGYNRKAFGTVAYTALWFLFLIAVFLVTMSTMAPKPF